MSRFLTNLEALMHEAVDDGFEDYEIMGALITILAQDCLQRVRPLDAAAAMGTILTNAVKLGVTLENVHGSVQ